MAHHTPRRVALLSIHPRHAEALMAGTKRVELRRTPVRDDTTHVIVYATAPVKAVVGWFQVEGVDVDSQTGIWNTHRHVSGVTRGEFRNYFAGAARASAIRVAAAHRLETPLSIDAIAGVKRPPQSFQYVDPASIRWLFDDGAGRALTG